jgi:hypothetical protein
VINSPAQSVWREGDKLVVWRGAVLPPLCVKCGRPSSGAPLRKTFYWHSSGWYLLILVNILVYAIGALIVRNRFDLALPLCEEHRRRRVAFLWFGGGLVLSVIVLPILGAMIANDDATGPLIVLGIGLFLAGIIFVAIGSRTLAPTRIDDERAIFKGAGQDYLSQFATLSSMGLR